MTHPQKLQIQTLLNEHCDRYDSQAKAAEALRVASEATVINIRKDKWDDISDDMWRKVGKQLGWRASGKWNIVPTRNYKTLMALFAEAQDYSAVLAITGKPGTGKSATATEYAGGHRNVHVIACSEYFNRKTFLSKILIAMGRENSGYTVNEMLDLIVETLMKQREPLLILDEADKLNDQVLYFFISLYNLLKDKCGIVLMSTNYLEKRLKRGVDNNKKGYKEIFSRIGRKFIALYDVRKAEVKAICEANGISDDLAITEIYNESEEDLRRVERAVHKKRRLAERSKTTLETA